MPARSRRRAPALRADRVHRLVVVDTETTGLGHVDSPPRPDAVVQVGYAWRNARGQVERWQATCNPGPRYLERGRAEEALRRNQLTEKEILASPSVRLVAKELRDRLREIEGTDPARLELRSYSRRFDEPFLSADPWALRAHTWGPCILEAARQYVGYGHRLKLWQAVERLGLSWPPGEAHSAASDSHAALLVLEELQRRFGAP